MKEKVLKFNRKGRLIFIACLLCVFVGILLSGCNGYSTTDMTVNDLAMQISVNADGSIDVTETHKVNFSDRGKDYWNYFKSISLDTFMSIPTSVDKFSFSVDGENFPTYGAANLDDGNYLYWQSMLQNKAYYYQNAQSKTFEMGVVMPYFEDGVRTITMRYSIMSAVENMNDASALYYFLVPKYNEMNIDKFSAKITFPETSLANTFAWLHLETGAGGIQLEYNASRGNFNGAYIEAENVPAGVSIETRITLDKTIFESATLRYRGATLESAKAEELAWYNAHMEKIEQQKTMAIVDVVLGIIVVLASIGFVVFAKFYRRRKKFEDSPEYLRDIPTDWSVEEAAPLFYYYDKKKYLSDVMSATILKLAKKYYIEIKPAEEKKKHAQIIVKNIDKSGLSKFEGIVLLLLESAAPVGEPFTMKQFENWTEANSSVVSAQMEQYEREYKAKSTKLGAFRKSDVCTKVGTTLGGIFAIGAALILFGGSFLYVLGIKLTFAAIGMIIGAIILSVIHTLKIPLTEQGEVQHLRFKALEKYMLDFSNLKEHEIPALILWEDYMVWATMMGVADKVSEQLEIAYPEYRELMQVGSNRNTFLFLYLFSPRIRFSMGLNFAATFGNMMGTVSAFRNAERMAHYQSKFGSGGGGSGRGGGGFGGGGGGFGGGGRMGGR